MKDFDAQLLDILDCIEGNGAFAGSGVQDFIPPGLSIRGVETISFPIYPQQAKALIKVAHKAPFGKGSQTVLDTTVRSVWEIDANQVSFQNKNWHKLIDTIVEDTKKSLGLEKQDIAAHLYKLLIYEKGDFFLPHKDSEKEKGMFGTLIVGLPSWHRGGELQIRFDGKEQKVSFADMGNDFTVPYAAFYADCEHEIKPITEGYRVCLVYNLVQKDNKNAIKLAETQSVAQELVELLESAIRDKYYIILLGHQYTPTNFSLKSLKLNDLPRAQALLQAAEQAGFYAKLGLLTSYQMGELEYESNYRSRKKRWNYYDDDEDEDYSNGTMGGEIYESSIDIEHWSENEALPPLRSIDISEEDIITNFELGDGEPIEKQAEGYTGNAGMTMEYWYHYGAIVLWHKSRHAEMLSLQSLHNQLEWVSFYLKNWQEAEPVVLKKMVVNFTEESINPRYDTGKSDFSVIVDLLIRLNDAAFVASEGCQRVLAYGFDKIGSKKWIELLSFFDMSIFKLVFEKITQSANENTLTNNFRKLTKLLKRIFSESEEPKLQEIGAQLLSTLPKHLNLIDFTIADKKEPITKILTYFLELSEKKNEDSEWQTQALQSIVKQLTPNYVNDILVPILLSSAAYKQLNLAQNIAQHCKEDLAQRTAVKPTPPTDWSREVPNMPYDNKIWAILKDFLESPTQQVFEYRRIQSDRNDMEYAIKRVTIDLKMETIKKGSPHLLKITKTQAAYERDLKIWHLNLALLNKLEQEFN